MNDDIGRLLVRLHGISDITEADERTLRSLPLRIEQVSRGTEIVRTGDRPNSSCLILSGLGARYKYGADGSRRILSFYLSGDIPDLQSLHLEVMDHSFGAVTACRLGFIAHEHLSRVFRSSMSLERAFWRAALIDAAIFREWIVRLGGMPAPQAMAHLFCEMAARAAAVGLRDGARFAFPVVQADLADALGITPVHVNRTLMALRKEKLLAFDDGMVTVLNWPGLVDRAQFDPLFLHQKSPADWRAAESPRDR